MDIKRFRTICRVSSVGLIVLAVLTIIVTAFIGYRVFTGSDFSFNYDGPGFSLFSMGGGGFFGEEESGLAASIIAPIILMITVYLYFKGSQLFKQLAAGKNPFTLSFAQSIRRLSIVLIVSDLMIPLLYSLVLTFIIEDGYYFTLGVGSAFLFGLLLYVISEIFNYGIELQYLADETV